MRRSYGPTPPRHGEHVLHPSPLTPFDSAAPSAVGCGQPGSGSLEPSLRPHALIHTVNDDHYRVAYAEIHDDETAVTATAVLARAVAWFAERGIIVERVLSDNGPAYRSHLWLTVCSNLGVTPKWTRQYRPKTNDKIERFHRTLADGWGYAHCYTSETERPQALPGWLHHYNHHRLHTACGSLPLFTGLTNVPGQYN